MRVLPGPTKSNQVLAWSPDGRFVVAGGTGDGIMAWDVDAGTPGRRVLTSGHGGRLMQFCPRTGRLYVAFQSGGVWSFDPDTGEERRRRPLSDYVMYYHLAVSGDGRTIVLRRSESNARTIVGYEVADDGALAEAWARPDGDGVTWSPFEFTFRPRTNQLFGLRDLSTFEWTTAITGEPVGSFKAASGRVTRWLLAPDGERVAWLSEHTLYLQRLGEPRPRVFPAVAGASRRGLAWSPDGRTLAYTTGPTVRLLDADTFTELRALDWGTGNARAVAFSPDGLRAAVSAEGGKGWVTVFDLE